MNADRNFVGVSHFHQKLRVFYGFNCMTLCGTNSLHSIHFSHFKSLFVIFINYFHNINQSVSSEHLMPEQLIKDNSSIATNIKFHLDGIMAQRFRKLF